MDPTSSDDPQDRRRFPRLRANCRIRVKPLDDDGVPATGSDAITVNISGGGLCYMSSTPVEVGRFLAVELDLPEFGSPVVALARASFCAPAANGHEVGIEFWWVGWGDESAQRAIAEYIKNELRAES